MALVQPLLNDDSYTLLSKEIERELLRQWCKEKNFEARARLFICNRGLVVDQAQNIFKYFYNTSQKEYISQTSCLIQIEDLVQEGYRGLHDAIEHFSLEKNNRFSTYAVPKIRKYIYDYITRNYSGVFGVNMNRRIMEFHTAKKRLEIKLGRPPEIDELAKDRKCSIAFMKSTIMAAGMSDFIIRLDEGIKNNSDSNSESSDSLSYFIHSEEPTPEQYILDIEEEEETQSQLESLAKGLEVLTSEEKTVICMKYGIGYSSDHTRTEIAKVLGISRRQLHLIDDIEQKALHKLREYMTLKVKNKSPYR